MPADDEAIAARLANELEQIDPGPEQPVAVLALSPFSAYTLVATLQFTSRNPQLLPDQRRLVLTMAHGIADQLTTVAARELGPDSAIETTLAAGFDPSHDVEIGGH
jgi:hypothetical protein